MRRNIQLSILAVMSIILTILLGGCGSNNREGFFVAGRVDEATCRVCHADSLDPLTSGSILPEFLASVHNQIPAGGTAAPGCQGCHGGGAQHNGVGPIPFPNPAAAGICITCHNDSLSAESFGLATNFPGNCANCHTPSGTSDVHSAQTTDTALSPTNPDPNRRNPDDCVVCHAVPAPQHGPNLVGDNNGVRAAVTEFSKWSHHVTGVTLNAAHCAACHLEGTVVDGAIVHDDTKHMADNKVHLRDTSNNTDADFAWDPMNPDHSGMDTFCMSCHDANGATSPMSAQIQAVINSNGIAARGKIASPSNPFGDTISNRYDKMQRPAVVDVSSQFNTTNNSQHGVKGPRYTGRTRDVAGPRTIASPGTFAQNSSALLQGIRSTIFDAGNFNQLYVPLENAGGEAAPRTGAQPLGDDSTLHCGDCHTVGQWKPFSATSRDGSKTPVAIGAHGSNNEYLLRNSIGTDERHTQNAFLRDPVTGDVTYTNPNGAFLVCYNCHAFQAYGSIFLRTGVFGGHVGEYDVSGRCNGIGNTLPFNGYTTGTATDGTQFVSRLGIGTNPNSTTAGSLARYASQPAFAPGFPLNGTPPAGEQNQDFGDIFGIQCANCHNSNGFYGGIHGSTVNTYSDGMGNTTKVERFLPGLGNAKHVPGTLGGFTGGTLVGPITNTETYSYITGGISNDTNWEQKHWLQTINTVIDPTTGQATGTAHAGAGCYTLGADQTVANNVTASQFGPSVTGQGGPATQMYGTWGGCDDHTAAQGAGRFGFVKKIVRPITY